MKFRARHRNLFYVPGMISLLLIPVLCLWHFYSHKSFEVVNAIDIGLPNDEDMAMIKRDYKFINERNYKEFTFNGSLEDNNTELIKFQQILKQQNKIKDTVNAIKLHFGRQMNYDVFIRILDILTIENTPTYIPYKSELTIVNASPGDIEKERKRREEKYGKQIQMSCGTQDWNNRQNAIEKENQRLIDNENFQKYFLKKHWYLFLAFSVMTFINLYMLIKFNKNKIYNQKSYI